MVSAALALWDNVIGSGNALFAQTIPITLSQKALVSAEEAETALLTKAISGLVPEGRPILFVPPLLFLRRMPLSANSFVKLVSPAGSVDVAARSILWRLIRVKEAKFHTAQIS